MSDPVAIRDPTRFVGPPARFVATNTRSTLIDRSRLDDRFEAATGGVIRVLGPGGYGKSTLAARWAAHDERAVRWLDLEAIDNDPLVLGHALRQAVANFRTAPLTSTAVPDLARTLATCTEPFVLVLDDLHHLESEASAALLSKLIAGLPSTSTLVLVGRAHHHAESIARFRLEPGMIDVATNDLAFDLAETEQLLTSMGVEPDIDVLTDLTNQFEGWPAGLRLAGMVMSSRQSGFEVPVNRLGSVEYVTDYITEEWFGGLKTADQNLLMQLGCLGRFSSDSCEEILGIADAATTLRRLCREEVVLFALDQLGDWYRLHPLLQRWLCSRLRSQNRARWCEIEVAAARWWERQGDIDLAIEHAVDGEDLDLCEELIATHAGLYSVRGMFTTVQRWLANLGEARIRSSPRLRIVASTVAIYAGDGEAALHWTRLAWEELNSPEVSAAHTDNHTMLQAEALRAGLEPLPAAEVIPIASHAYHLLPVGPFRAFTGVVLGVNRYIAGEERGVDTLRQALFENDVGDWLIMNAGAAAALAIVLDLEGQRDEAGELCARALRLLTTRSGGTYPAIGLTMAMASLIDARAGRSQRASERIGLSLIRLDALDNCAPWYRIPGLVTLIRTCLLLDDAQTAGNLLQQLETSMAIQDRTTPFARHVDDLRDRVQAANELRAERLWSLTAAELRVAQYLPTNLSLSEIATRLYVSRNTVKSHAAAIYRKLGTSSRGEAVQRARSAGLIGDAPPATD